MQTFGEKLRLAIEASSLPLDEIARRTGFEPRELNALRADDLAALPEDGSVPGKLRAFAMLMGVDEEDVLEDYRTARERTPRKDPPRPAAIPDPPAPGRPETPSSRRGGRLRPAWIGVGAVVLLLAGFLFLRGPGPRELNRSSGPDVDLPAAGPATDGPSAGHEAPSHPVAPRTAAAAPGRSGSPTVAPSPAPSPAVAPRTGTASRSGAAASVTPAEPDGTGMTIASHGVGTGVKDHVLTGERTEFSTGATVWFFTDVRGAGPGERIDHVWLHEGREELRVPLRIGGERWRTQSYKTLRSGSAGEWIVEARDDDGRVLARTVFRCLPA